MKTNTLTPKLLNKMDAYRHAVNYQPVGQIYLYDDPRLKPQMALADVKLMLLGHWSTTPWHDGGPGLLRVNPKWRRSHER